MNQSSKHHRVSETPSSGIKRVIIDIDEAVSTISQALES
jgi:hypothetical protein